MRTVMVSGGFDPLHPGHLEFFRQARRHGDRLVVAVEPDEYVARKHKVMLPQAARLSMLVACRLVDEVVPILTPGDCSHAIEIINPSVFCVGSDHRDMQFPEAETCKRRNIDVKVLDSIRGSSSELIAKVQWDNPPVCVSALVIRNDRVLLAKRAGTDCWELPGGFLERNEQLETACSRELLEETGARAVNLRYHWSTPAVIPDGRNALCVYFLADMIDEPRPTKECNGFEWASSVDGVKFFCAADKLAIAEWNRRADLCG